MQFAAGVMILLFGAIALLGVALALAQVIRSQVVVHLHLGVSERVLRRDEGPSPQRRLPKG